MKIERACDYCGKKYQADKRNLKRGWDLCCCKSHAAKKRERAKPTWNARDVSRNNFKRKHGCFPEDYCDNRIEESDGSWDAHECQCEHEPDYKYL